MFDYNLAIAFRIPIVETIRAAAILNRSTPRNDVEQENGHSDN